MRVLALYALLGCVTALAGTPTTKELHAYRDDCRRRRAPMQIANKFGRDLRGSDLRGLRLAVDREELPAIDFGGCDLRGARLDESLLLGASFRGAVLDQLDGARLQALGCDFSWTSLIGARFAGARLTGSSFQQARLVDVDFSGADLRGVLFLGAHIERGDFSGAMLEHARFNGAYLAPPIVALNEELLGALDAANRRHDFELRAYPPRLVDARWQRLTRLLVLAALALLGGWCFRAHAGLAAFRWALALNAICLVAAGVDAALLFGRPVIAGAAATSALRLMLGLLWLSMLGAALTALQHAVVRVAGERRPERALLALYLMPSVLYGAVLSVELAGRAVEWGVIGAVTTGA